jgi:type IX secretion system PorP/SprF family membrane protein
MRAIISTLLFAAIRGLVFAQDIHWSMTANNLLYQNAAFAGLSERYTIAGSYRDQWNVLGQTYRSQMASADMRFEKDNHRNGLAGGLQIFSDNAADYTFRTTCAGGVAAYQFSLDKFSKLAGGIGLNFFQSSINSDPYTWGSQFNGNSFDPNLPGETFVATRHRYTSIRSGIAYYMDERSEGQSAFNSFRWIVGYAVDHLNRPDAGMFGQADRLPMKHTIHTSAYLPGRSNLSLKPMITANITRSMYQVIGGVVFQYSMGEISRYTGNKKGSSIGFGLLYRSKDAMIPVIEYERANVMVALSYDVNVSKLTAASNLRGGFEISLKFRPAGDFLFEEKETPKKVPTTRSQY